MAHIRKFIKPGGFLLLATGCQGISLNFDALNLWSAATAGCGRLPRVDEMRNQLMEADYKDINSLKLIPTDCFYAFQAYLVSS